jgi:hypothetical protein
MVYLALEPTAAAEAIEAAKKNGAAVWVGSDAISHEEHYNLVAEGVKVTRFEYPLSKAENSVVTDALSTVAEHHPNEVIWVQYVAQL